MCSSTVRVNGVALIEAGLTALAETVPAELIGSALGDELAELHRLSTRLSAELSRRLAVFHIRGDAAADGMLSTQSWLTHRLRMSRAHAGQQAAVAAVLSKLPGTASAYAAGALSIAHVAVLARGAERIGIDTVAAAEPILLEAAAVLDPAGLRRVLTHLRHVVDPDGADDDAAAAYERRGLWCSPTLDGMVVLDGLLDPDTGAALMEAVNSGPPPAADDRRTPAQSRADRLGEVVRDWLAAGDATDNRGASAQVTLTADLATLRGEPGSVAAALDWIGPLDLSTARLIGCDCRVTGIVLGGDGTPLNVGWRHRTVTPAQRAALTVRDKHCQAPGCDRPARWCDAHHVKPWYDGGRTDLSNLVLLCRRHHRAIHQRSWRIEPLGGGRFRFQLTTDRATADEPSRNPRAG